MDRYNNPIAKILGMCNNHELFAVTISSTCTLYSCFPRYINKSWFEHEEMHKRQIRRDGWFKFMTKYLWYNMTVGYDKNPYEVEAGKVS
jgi:hypothetical protein